MARNTGGHSIIQPPPFLAGYGVPPAPKAHVLGQFYLLPC